MDTKGKNPKQDLTSVKDLTIELPGGRQSPTIDYTNYRNRNNRN